MAKWVDRVEPVGNREQRVHIAEPAAVDKVSNAEQPGHTREPVAVDKAEQVSNTEQPGYTREPVAARHEDGILQADLDVSWVCMAYSVGRSLSMHTESCHRYAYPSCHVR